MKKLLFVSLMLNVQMHAQITFEKIFSGKGISLSLVTAEISSDSTLPILDNIRLDVIQTSDQGYARIGSLAVRDNDVNSQLVRYDKFGNILWNKTFGGPGNDFGMSLQKTTDGGYIFAGSTSSYGSGGYDVQLVKTDSLGNEIWSKTFGGAGNDYASSLKTTPDGGFIIAGSTNSFGAGHMDMYVIRTDSNGNLLWFSTYGGISEDKGNSVCLTSGGGFAVIGTTKSFGSGGTDAYLVNLDSLGNKIFSGAYGSTDEETGKKILQTANGFIIAGRTASVGAGSSDIYLMQTDLAGNISWTRTFGGLNAEEIGSLISSTDGGYIFAGSTGSFGAGGSDVYIIKTDVSGNETWAKTYGSTSDDYADAVIQTQDGGYAILGYTENFAAKKESHFIKTGVSGSTYCSTNSFSPVTGNVIFTRTSSSPVSGIIPANTISASVLSASDSVESVETLVLCSGQAALFQAPVNTLSSGITNSNAAPDAVVGSPRSVVMASKDISLTIFPNPGTGEFYIKGLLNDDILQIINVEGKILYTNEKCEPVQMINITGSPKGFYYYKVVHSSGRTDQGKIILD